MSAPNISVRKQTVSTIKNKNTPSAPKKSPAEKRDWYLFVVGKRLVLSRQRVRPVLSHGPLLRWHGFHQDSIDPRVRAHSQCIPMMRVLSPKFIRRRAGHAPEENPWWRGADPEEEEVNRARCLLLCVRLCLRAPFDLSAAPTVRLIWIWVLWSKRWRNTRLPLWLFKIKNK